jgi:hypothetical protein
MDTSKYHLQGTDCHDVELRNECRITVTVSTTKASILADLTSRFAAKSTSYNDEYVFSRPSQSYSKRTLHVGYMVGSDRIIFSTYYE